MNTLQFPQQTSFYRGKVRDVYTIADKWLVMIASDRISAFDVILPRPIPYKGQVLNQIAAYMLKATSDICPNWLTDTPAPHVAIGLKCSPFRVEMVVRGNLTGHSWRVYSSGKRELCGVPLPEGLKENDYFPSPIITPSTKAEVGHDEDISRDEIIRRLVARRDAGALVLRQKRHAELGPPVLAELERDVQPRWLAIVEQTLDSKFEHSYLLLEDQSGQVRAIQPLFFVQQNLVGH